MSTLTPQTVVLLERLLSDYRQAEAVFRRAAGQVQPDRIQILLLNYAQMRSQLARELESALYRARRTALRSEAGRINGHEDLGDSHYANGNGHGNLTSALEDCRNSDDDCLNLCPSILRRELSQPLRQIVSRQYAAVRADHERLCELLPSLQSEAGSHSHSSA